MQRLINVYASSFRLQCHCWICSNRSGSRLHLSSRAKFRSTRTRNVWKEGRVPDMDVSGCKFLSFLDIYMLKSTSVTLPTALSTWSGSAE
jgi:hypothetical protein